MSEPTTALAKPKAPSALALAQAAAPASDQHLVAIESALVDGDMSKLTVGERVSYYNTVCKSVGLNPATRPFGYLSLNGKLVLYSLKNATDQLREVHNVSLQVMKEEQVGNNCWAVHVKAVKPMGGGHFRSDEDLGVVMIGDAKGNLFVGDAYANARMKAMTKAKRRVTLSICGLSLLDESELDTVKKARIVDVTYDAPREPDASAMYAPATKEALLALEGCVTREQLEAVRADLKAGKYAIPKAESGVVKDKVKQLDAALPKTEEIVHEGELEQLQVEAPQ